MTVYLARPWQVQWRKVEQGEEWGGRWGASQCSFRREGGRGSHGNGVAGEGLRE